MAVTDLDIMSWNINDASDSVLGPKPLNPDFLKIVEYSKIFCFQETKNEVKIPDFTCHNKLRQDSRSGGLCIGVRRDISSYVNIVDTRLYDDIMAVRISRKLLNQNQDLILVNVYDSPEMSSYKRKKVQQGIHKNTLDSLSKFLANIKDALPFVVGDLNARTSNRCDQTNGDGQTLDELCNGTFTQRSHPLNTTRNSEDSVLNERGKKLLDLVAETNLKILNGSIIGDVLGRFTCLHYNGSSVVDYMLASEETMSSIAFFKVLGYTDFSDHRPITCKIRGITAIQRLTIGVTCNEPKPRFIWDALVSPHAFWYEQNSPTIIEKCNEICSSQCESTKDVYDLSGKLEALLTSVADATLEKKKPYKVRRGKRKPRKNAWFDTECIKSRIVLRKACRAYCKAPLNEEFRISYYLRRKEHRRLIKQKKDAFLWNLNREIEDNNNIKWDSFKKLKNLSSPTGQDLDLYDLANFYRFFKELYAKKTLSQDRIQEINKTLEDLQKEPIDPAAEELLNSQITIDELSTNIKKLKKGKAVAEDNIANEFLRNSNPNTRKAILKVFNACLEKGVYPWNTALITPLHKKGDKSDPNNYRAIAVGSNLGKLFSGILLERLICYRKANCPDPINQLGFVKASQTADHILTLNTCIEKYLKKSKKLYGCFIDYQKAFDTVCREALLMKLSRLGIKGKYFECISYMYKSSSAKIKLLNKISDAMDILIGTEQGHPMSPELFKTYLLDMSDDLNILIDIEVPELNGITISHLLWADDLVLLALSQESLQILINRVHEFCLQWGLTINISKTAIMVFNRSGRQLLESYGFTYGEVQIPSARSYCYLGIVFNLCGSFTVATDELRKKGLRAYFSLKSIVDLSALTVKSVFKLFDALILPVVSYGCQAWLQSTQFAKAILKQVSGKDLLKRIAHDPIERLHLKFLKWTLQVHKKCSNLACYGDSGRYPLVIVLAKQVTSYYNRLRNMEASDDNSLVRHAFSEQKIGNMSWYTNMSALLQLADQSTNDEVVSPTLIKTSLQRYFDEVWQNERICSKKLAFYNLVKQTSAVQYEPYLDLKDCTERKCLMRLRSSSHRLNHETGRYITPKDMKHDTIPQLWFRRCEFCTADDAELFCHLPFAEEPVIEDELHVLISCPKYHTHRTNLEGNAKCQLLRNEEHWLLFQGDNIRSFAKYVKKIFMVRFPKKSSP